VLIRQRHLVVRVAEVADSITILVEAEVGDTRAEIAVVAGTIAILIVRRARRDHRARVTRVAERIAVRIRLVGVDHRRAVVARIADSITIDIGSVGIDADSRAKVKGLIAACEYEDRDKRRSHCTSSK
jgi:hypothetical protein